MKTCLYFSYDGLLDPLGQSQILPYIKNLNQNGYKFIIISYEKTHHAKKTINKLKNKLLENDILWKPLYFRRSRIFFLYRFLLGAFYINFFHLRKNIDLVHLRGGIPGLIYLISFCRNKYLYDLRAFWGQSADGGIVKYDSIAYKLLLNIEKKLIKGASGLIVLDKSGHTYVNRKYKLDIPFEIIPTSTNVEKYNLEKKANKSIINFVYLGGVRYPPYNINSALLFVENIRSSGFRCKIDFINNNEHNIIKKVLRQDKFKKIKFSIKSLDHNEVYKILSKYDVGFIFLANGKWIRMSSPTKIGEYLAAGLVIIGNKGIAVIDRLSKESKCVESINFNKEGFHYDNEKIQTLLKKINNFQNRKESNSLAKKYYSLKNANAQYLKIYKKIFKLD